MSSTVNIGLLTLYRPEKVEKAEKIVDIFGGRIGDLTAVINIHVNESLPLDGELIFQCSTYFLLDAVQVLWNLRYHDLAETLSSVEEKFLGYV